ncbi:MAG: hypothetical protein HOQ11_01000 [Gemmatimonadaceae bacterium]|nr:hypothetical protein [Gemmatimonadaceae bacterium]NUQ92184.1 hypothetical protein [Gemmatimonadaceae bacterium]NUR20965.1 hypothetical protein [Gemmatimonadaceae bacterium]NUS95965.1 hypothetical protein [Gemmatimonadaceae bacterium]
MSRRFPRLRVGAIARAALPLLVALAMAGCGDDDPVAPPSPAGTYSATTFTATDGGTTTNVLAAGGSITLVLTPQGTTSGHLYVPASVTGDVDLDDDLTGTWSQSGSTVQLSHPADTFLRDMPLTMQNGKLVGDRTFGTLRVQLTLSPGMVALTR